MPLVYGTTDYQYLTEQLCKKPEFQAGEISRQDFADGERLINYKTSPAGQEVVLVGGTIDDRNTLELFDLACGLVGLGANRLSVVIPYFGYSTQERAVTAGDLITAKARANLLSAIPQACLTNEIFLLDLHTDGIACYFDSRVHCRQIKSITQTASLIRTMVSQEDGIVAATDAGRAKWVETLANEAGLPAAFVYKRRTGETTTISGVNANVKGKHVVIYDDMVRSGSSLINAAKAYQNAGAAKISAIFSHGILPGDSAQRLVDSKLFTELHTTESHPQALRCKALGIKVHGIADLIHQVIR